MASMLFANPSIVDCIVSDFVAAGLVAVATLNRVANRTHVPVTVMQSPSVVKAEFIEYPVIIR